MRRQPLPDDLGPAFTVREALGLGVRRDRLTARDLRAPFHGIRTRADAMAEEVLSRCRTYEPRLTSAQFFSHTTAAALWDLPSASFDATRLHVSALPPAREPRTRGITGHRLDLPIEHLTLRHGLPVPTAAETWAQLGGFSRVEDLVAVGDAILTRRLAERANLEEATHRLARRGVSNLRAALPLLRAGAESPRESLVRLILVRAGLPEPELNRDLRDDSGHFVARLDLAYPEYRVAVEYDGRQHADLTQFRRDADRWPAIAAQGWMLVRVVDHHLRDPVRFVVAPVERVLRSRGWRP
ncbi:hypothetical protein [Microbacterium sp. 22296]|uniref:hypothetical protein n=1 Tax=Microbacterium sp. 22296 TaxID=3453903 RepID=UPI003F85CB57